MPPKKLGKGGRTKALLEKVKKKVTTLVSRSGSGDFANQSIANSQPPSSTSAPSGGPAPPSSLPSPTPEPDPLPPVNWALHGLHARHRRPVLDRSLMHYGKYATSYRKRKRRLPGPEEEWVLRGTVAVDDIPMWFEREVSDAALGGTVSNTMTRRSCKILARGSRKWLRASSNIGSHLPEGHRTTGALGTFVSRGSHMSQTLRGLSQSPPMPSSPPLVIHARDPTDDLVAYYGRRKWRQQPRRSGTKRRPRRNWR